MKKLLMIVIFLGGLGFVWVKTDYKEPAGASAARVTRRKLPVEKPYDFPGDYTDSHKKLAGVFESSTSMFTEGNVPVLTLPPFTMTTGGGAPELLNLVTESAYSYLYNDRKVRVVRRDYTSEKKSRIRANYILIGRVSTIGDQIRITVRIQDLRTGEIVDAFDDYIERAKLGKYL
jgi:TolB-like protein